MEPEVIVIDDHADEVCCDGGGGPLGHPIVWYSFDTRDMVECGYCDRRFIKKRAAEALDVKEDRQQIDHQTTETA